MGRYRITPAATRMAWEMIRTIFPCRKVTPADANSLLNQLTLIALGDLLNRRLRWKQRPGGRLQLRFKGQAVEVSAPERGKASICAVPGETEINQALDRAEATLDRYELDDEERATLYTALPCLGLDALSGYVEWDSAPPFPELGPE